jgi:probable phosphoglycerate mutase
LNLFFIRHGEKYICNGDVSSIILTDKGHRQADLVAKRLASYSIDAIYSSTMTRAFQTADAIMKYTQVRIEQREGLKEINMGECDKHGWEYTRLHYPDFIREFEKHDTDMPYPNGECGSDVWKRAMPVLDEIFASDYKNVAIVTHGGTIRSVICGILEIPQEKRFVFGAPPEHCSITHVKYLNERYFIHTFNDYSHLGDEL